MRSPFLGAVAILLAFAPPTPCQPLPNHPFNRFEIGFHLLLKDYSWHKFTPQEEKRLVRNLWGGAHKESIPASMSACVGVMESHFDIPSPSRYANYRGKDYSKVRGHCGTHNQTVLAEVKRLKLGGRREMWLALWKRDPIGCDYYAASRMQFLLRIYKTPYKTLRIWVVGPEGLDVPKDAKRSDFYARNVLRLMDRYFHTADFGTIPSSVK